MYVAALFTLPLPNGVLYPSQVDTMYVPTGARPYPASYNGTVRRSKGRQCKVQRHTTSLPGPTCHTQS